MIIPRKPFSTFKWRWLSFQPSEGLLKAPVFLGVLRALQEHEGQPYSSMSLYRELVRVKEDTRTNIDLARTPSRNLFRNSGQYWRGTGLLERVHGEIRLTNLGHTVASGRITNDEFAALMVRNTVLPNPQTYHQSEIQKWQDANIRIKPLELILSVMDRLGREYGVEEAYISPNELIKVVIPLSGEKKNITDICYCINKFRNGRLDVSQWPDCAPRANDKRLAREFLLFLDNFGICQSDDSNGNYQQKFSLNQLLNEEILLNDDRSFLEDMSIIDEEVSIAQTSEIPIMIERKRVARNVLYRPSQSRFRRDVLKAAKGRCLLTNEETPEVLESPHIIPVEYGGTDLVGNGLCMRVDIHRLFDGGKIRLAHDGSVTLSEELEKATSYTGLPRDIIFPDVVDMANVIWRTRYL